MNRSLAELGLAGSLAVAVAVSGLLLIRVEHDARQRFVELEELNREQDRLQIDWGRLQLEQSTWATHSRIESLARERLDLAAPKTEQIVVVSEAEDERGDRDRAPIDATDGDPIDATDGHPLEERFGELGRGRVEAPLAGRIKARLAGGIEPPLAGRIEETIDGAIDDGAIDEPK